MSGEPEQVRSCGAQGASGKQEGPAETSRQPQTERATGRRNPMKPKCIGASRKAARPSVAAEAERSIRITIREAGGWQHEFALPANLALSLAWQILAASVVGGEEVL